LSDQNADLEIDPRTRKSFPGGDEDYEFIAALQFFEDSREPGLTGTQRISVRGQKKAEFRSRDGSEYFHELDSFRRAFQVMRDEDPFWHQGMMYHCKSPVSSAHPRTPSGRVTSFGCGSGSSQGFPTAGGGGQVGLAWLLNSKPGWQGRITSALEEMAANGKARTGQEYFAASNTFKELEQSLSLFFNDCDVILTPTVAALPWPATEPYPKRIDGQEVRPRTILSSPDSPTFRAALESAFHAILRPAACRSASS
jgi:hypothetical protein